MPESPISNEVIESLMNHKSIRKFEKEPVELDVLEVILRAGTRAATAGNLQLYSLIVVDDPEKLKTLGFEFAPLVIAAFVDQYRIKRWFEISDTAPVCVNRASNLFIGYWDAIIALHNVVIAAESLGLGGCYYGGILAMDTQKIFETPQHVFPAGMVTIGYPAETPDLKIRLPIEAVIHRNTYRPPTDEELKEYYREREGWWDAVSDEQRAELAKQKIRSIPQAIAIQKYSDEVVDKVSKKIEANILKSGFVLGITK